MSWSKLDEMYITRYTKMVVGGAMTIEQVPEKYREEVQKRVDAWFTAKAEAEALATQQSAETETI